jgi:hypothetical protein
MASTPARDPAKSSMDAASANKESPKPCSRLHSAFRSGGSRISSRCSHEGQHRGRTIARFLRGLARQREAAQDGASHLGAEGYSDHPDRLEERSQFRRQTFEQATVCAHLEASAVVRVGLTAQRNVHPKNVSAGARSDDELSELCCSADITSSVEGFPNRFR